MKLTGMHETKSFTDQDRVSSSKKNNNRPARSLQQQEITIVTTCDKTTQLLIKLTVETSSCIPYLQITQNYCPPAHAVFINAHRSSNSCTIQIALKKCN
jgi:hypothetical protein